MARHLPFFFFFFGLMVWCPCFRLFLAPPCLYFSASTHAVAEAMGRFNQEYLWAEGCDESDAAFPFFYPIQLL